MKGAVVIGVGNAWRGDDAAGLLAARQVAAAAPAMRVLESDGEPAALMEMWADAKAAYLIDCCRGAGPAGSLHRFNAAATPLPAALGAISSHGIDIAATIELARALGALPARLTVFAIEGADFTPGTAPSPAVAAAATRAAAMVLDDTC